MDEKDLEIERLKLQIQKERFQKAKIKWLLERDKPKKKKGLGKFMRNEENWMSLFLGAIAIVLVVYFVASCF